HSASPAVQVLCLTGRIGEEQRRLRVAEFMREATQRVLVATDCLSEGINLQRGFNAVIHYDLPWNPNRLEQREGRVDRFEQPSPVVKVVRFYGQDNPVDGAVLWVLLNKAKEIQHALGTHVPVPTDGRALVEVLVQALFIKRGVSHRQLTLDYSDDDLISGIHQRWELDLRREKQSRTRFAQYTLDPQEVQRELEATDRIFGDPNSVRQFVLATCQRLGIPIRRSSQGDDRWEITTETAALQEVPMAVRQALPNNRRASWLITFTSPTPEGVDYLGRNHPFVVALARYLFESAFADHTPGPTARCGAIRSRAVDQLTAVLLLRPRFHLEQPGHPPLLAEEVFVVGWRLATDQWLPPDQALQLLETQSDANIPLTEKRELVSLVLTKVQTILQTSDPSSPLAQLLRRRAAELEEAHRRVRQSIGQAIRGLHVLPLGNP
ncbi:MAG: SWF/SNF helicase family protein, partial [Gemmataceae bacterium]|nr:SWF/SNF helicase family protein [Gemmataceae bacterium]